MGVPLDKRPFLVSCWLGSLAEVTAETCMRGPVRNRLTEKALVGQGLGYMALPARDSAGNVIGTPRTAKA